MSTLTWFNTSGGSPHQLTSDNSGYLYVSMYSNSKIGKISLTNPSTDYNLSWATVTGNNPNGLFIYQGYIYSLNNNNNTISRFSLTNPSTDFSLNWASNGMNGALGVFLYGGYIYVANNGSKTIGKISLTSPNTDYNASWATFTNVPWVMTLYNNYIYVAFVNTNKIGKISFSNPVGDHNESWATTGSGPIGLAIYGNYIYASNNNNKIGYNNLTNPNTDSSNSWVTITANSGTLGLTVVNNYLYTSNADIGTISKILLPDLPLSSNNETLWSSTGISTSNVFPFNIHIFGGYMFFTTPTKVPGLYRTTFPTPTTWTKTISGGNLVGMDDDGTYLYLSCTSNTTNISGGFIRCDVNGNIDNSWYVSPGATYYQFIIKDGYIYATKYNAGTIVQINIASQTITTSWANLNTVNSDLSGCNPYGITSVGNNLYVNTNNPSYILKIPIVPGNPPTRGTITILDTSANDPYFSNSGNGPTTFANYFNQSLFMGFSSISGDFTNIIRQYDLGGNLLTPVMSSIPVTNPFTAITTNGIYLYAFSRGNGNIYQYQLGSMSVAGSFTITGAFNYTH
jgi:hypothetical protein